MSIQELGVTAGCRSRGVGQGILITVIKHLTGSTLRKGEFNPAHRLTALPAWLGSLSGKRHKAAGHAPSRGSESRDWIDGLA